jgi:WD40 repeat protein
VDAAVAVPHDGITVLAWNLDASRFATSGNDGVVRIWDPADPSQPLAERALGNGLIESVAWFPDGRIAVFESSGMTYALDGETLEDAGPRVSTAYRFFIGQTAWDDVVVSSVQDVSDVAVLVDVDSGAVETLEVGFVPFTAAASPDRSRVAITGGGGELRILSRDGWLAPGVSAHGSPAVWAAWSPDGSVVATGGADGVVALWDGATGALLGSLTPGSAGVPVSPYFTEAGQLSVAAADGTVYTFSTDVNAWIDFACQVAGRDLTEREWREAFGARPFRATCP